MRTNVVKSCQFTAEDGLNRTIWGNISKLSKRNETCGTPALLGGAWTMSESPPPPPLSAVEGAVLHAVLIILGESSLSTQER